MTIEHLSLESSKEVLHDGIVMAVASSGHGLDDVVFLQNHREVARFPYTKICEN